MGRLCSLLGSSIQTGEIDALAVTTAKINNLAVTAGKIGPKAVETAKIDDEAVGATQLDSDAVTTVKILDANVTKAKAETGFGRYVPRNCTQADFTTEAFTTNGSWQTDGLDLSAIVPAGAIAVHIAVQTQDNAVGSIFAIQQNATNNHNRLYTITQQATALNHQIETIIKIDANRLLDYYATNTTFTSIGVTILGYFI